MATIEELERRLLVVETELIGENIQLAKRLWAMLVKYEPETIEQMRKEADEPDRA